MHTDPQFPLPGLIFSDVGWVAVLVAWVGVGWGQRALASGAGGGVCSPGFGWREEAAVDTVGIVHPEERLRGRGIGAEDVEFLVIGVAVAIAG